MNDDLLKYNPEEDIDMDKEIKKASTPSKGGSKLSTIFLIVLGVHVLIIIGVSAFHLLKGNKESITTQEVFAAQDQSATTEMPSVAALTSEQPAVETEHSTTQLVTEKTSTPSMNDPVWNTSTLPAPTPEKVTTTPVEKPMPAVTQTETIKPAIPVTKSYTVVKGDTLSKIARRNGTSVAALRKANKLKKDIIKIGQKLTIPSKVVSSAKQVTKAPTKLVEPILPSIPLAAADGYKTYKVEKGDTLSKIARLFHTTPAKLAQLNGLDNPNKLKIGMSLKVPSEQVATRQNTSAGTETPAVKPFRTPVSNTDLAMLRSDNSI